MITLSEAAATILAVAALLLVLLATGALMTIAMLAGMALAQKHERAEVERYTLLPVDEHGQGT